MRSYRETGMNPQLGNSKDHKVEYEPQHQQVYLHQTVQVSQQGQPKHVQLHQLQQPRQIHQQPHSDQQHQHVQRKPIQGHQQGQHQQPVQVQYVDHEGNVIQMVSQNRYIPSHLDDQQQYLSEMSHGMTDQPEDEDDDEYDESA